MTARPGALAGLRVLDIAGPMGTYCGKLFAELGADVVLVEPPGGAEQRHDPPFAGGEARPADSLRFAYHNTSKRGICLDLDTPLGAEALRDLSATADLVIESEPPGTQERRGLGWDDLSRDHPELVLTSITPFGQTGPYAQYPADDLVCLAMGGMLSLSGYRDGPPVAPAGEQALVAGNLFGAVASMLAITTAETTGRGQHVDVSVQECVAMGLENAAQFYDLEGVVRGRTGGTQVRAGSGVFGCADGYVYVLAGGIGGNRFWPNLVAWLESENTPEFALLRDDRWGDRAHVESDTAKETFARVFGTFARTRAKADLYRAAQHWRVPLCPVSDAADILDSPQLRHREFFTRAGGDALMPGAPYRLSDTPWRMTSPAPRLGEHTDAVLADIGWSPQRRQALAPTGGRQ